CGGLFGGGSEGAPESEAQFRPVEGRITINIIVEMAELAIAAVNKAIAQIAQGKAVLPAFNGQLKSNPRVDGIDIISLLIVIAFEDVGAVNAIILQIRGNQYRPQGMGFPTPPQGILSG